MEVYIYFLFVGSGTGSKLQERARIPSLSRWNDGDNESVHLLPHREAIAGEAEYIDSKPDPEEIPVTDTLDGREATLVTDTLEGPEAIPVTDTLDDPEAMPVTDTLRGNTSYIHP